jgi:hypothetical protein
MAAAMGISLSILAQDEAIRAAAQTTLAASAFQRWLIAQLHMGTGDAAAFERIIVPLGAVLAVVFLLAHVTAVPWALAARREALGRGGAGHARRWRNVWIVVTLGPVAVLVLAGLVGWVVILRARG